MKNNEAIVAASTPLVPEPLPPELAWAAPPAPEHAGFQLDIYLHILRKHRWRIASFVLVATTLVTLGVSSLPREYRSTAVLRVDPSALRTVGESNSGAGSDQAEADRLLATEATVVASPEVIRHTIQDLHLYNTPEFRPADRRNTPDIMAPTAADMNQVLKAVTKRVSVSQPFNTYLLSVSFEARSPQLAAQVANDLLASLIHVDFKTRVQELLGASQSMTTQLAALRARMEASQRALVTYESANDVLGADSKNNIMEASLDQANQQLAQAESKRIQLEAEYEAVKSGGFDALQVVDPGGSLAALRGTLLQDQSRLVRIAQVDGPKHPLFLEQSAIVAHDKAVLNTAEKELAAQVRIKYETAERREALLAKDLGRKKAALANFNLNAIQYGALKAAADSYSKLFYQLQQNVQDANVAATLRAGGLAIIEAAQPNSQPVFPRPLLTAGLALLVSSLVGVGAALTAGALDRTVSSPDQVEAWFGVAVLGSLPMVKDPLVLSGLANWHERQLTSDELRGAGAEAVAGARAAAPFYEAVLSIRSALLFSHPDIQVLAVTSSVPEEGKSTISSHLAAAFANTGKSVVLVDADLRRPTAHRRLQLRNRVGLSTLLQGGTQLDAALQPLPGMGNLKVITAGPAVAGAAELLHVGLDDVVQELRNRFDCVILDCPPLLGFAEVGVVTRVADGTVLVAYGGKTERPRLAASLRQLRAFQARVLGVVLNRVSASVSAYYNYYEGYEHRYYRDAEEGEGGGD